MLAVEFEIAKWVFSNIFVLSLQNPSEAPHRLIVTIYPHCFVLRTPQMNRILFILPLIQVGCDKSIREQFRELEAEMSK